MPMGLHHRPKHHHGRHHHHHSILPFVKRRVIKFDNNWVFFLLAAVCVTFSESVAAEKKMDHLRARAAELIAFVDKLTAYLTFTRSSSEIIIRIVRFGTECDDVEWKYFGCVQECVLLRGNWITYSQIPKKVFHYFLPPTTESSSHRDRDQRVKVSKKIYLRHSSTENDPVKRL